MEAVEYVKMDALEHDHWWFRAKRSFLKVIVHRFVGDGHGKQLLDIGCGTGAVLESFRDSGWNVEGIDMSEDAVRYSQKKRLSARVGRAEALPFVDETFDVVIAADVLEHIADTKAVLVEIRRILKPGGIFVAAVPAHQWLFSSHDVALHHVRRYSRSLFATSLGAVFSIRFIGWIHATILLPAIAVRALRRVGAGGGESDVRPSHPLVNRIMSVVYFLEVGCLKLRIPLPWGLSLLAVVEKKSE